MHRVLPLLLLSSVVGEQFTNIGTTSVHYHVIVTQPRSGSTYFSSLLRSHPCVMCFMEKYSIGETRDIRPVLYKQLDSNHSCSFGSLSVGVKNMLFENKEIPGLRNNFLNLQKSDIVSALGTYLEQSNIRVILFLRRNLLEYFVSRHSGSLKLPQHCTSTATRAKQLQCKAAQSKTLTIDIEKFKEFVHDMVAIQAAAVNGFSRIASDYNVPVLYVPYEYLVKEKHNVHAQIIEFLGVSVLNQTLSSTYQKRIQSNMTSLITNWKQALAVMADVCPTCEYGLDPILGVPDDQKEMKFLGQK